MEKTTDTKKSEVKNRTTQKKIVLSHLLEFGCITPNEAIYKYKITRLADVIYKYKITRLADVIYKLKKDGYRIKSEDVWTINTETGNPCRYALYTIVLAA